MPMPSLNNQNRFTLTFAHLKKDFHPQGYQLFGQQALDQLYCFEIERVIDRHFLDADDYLHKTACLSFEGQQDHGGPGVIHGFTQGETRVNMTHYHRKLVPSLFYRNHRTNQRILQYQTVQDIISNTLKSTALFIIVISNMPPAYVRTITLDTFTRPSLVGSGSIAINGHA
jgi:type VI secretion system secreted protein VgrG